MQISLLSGAYKNAGDFLIVHRSKELIKDTFPECDIIEYERRNSLEDKLDAINGSDVLILAGGPGYVTNLYPKVMPLVEDLDKIKVPLFAMAMGWGGAMDSQIQYIHINFQSLLSNYCAGLKRMDSRWVAETFSRNAFCGIMESIIPL